ncbi:MAG: T9SS type A sorting domain-containing protein [Luteibaculaceae bacterium]
MQSGFDIDYIRSLMNVNLTPTDFNFSKINIRLNKSTSLNITHLYATAFLTSKNSKAGNYVVAKMNLNDNTWEILTRNTQNNLVFSPDGNEGESRLAIDVNINGTEVIFGGMYLRNVKLINNIWTYTNNSGVNQNIGGQNPPSFHMDVHAIELQKNGNSFLNYPNAFVGHDGGVSYRNRTNNTYFSGSSGWIYKNNGLATNWIWSMDLIESEKYLLGNLQDNYSTLKKVNWNSVNVPGDGYGSAYSHLRNEIIITRNGSGLLFLNNNYNSYTNLDNTTNFYSQDLNTNPYTRFSFNRQQIATKNMQLQHWDDYPVRIFLNGSWSNFVYKVDYYGETIGGTTSGDNYFIGNIYQPILGGSELINWWHSTNDTAGYYTKVSGFKMTDLYTKTTETNLRPSLSSNWIRQINSFIISPVNHKKVYISLWKNSTQNVDENGAPINSPWNYGVSRFFVGIDNSNVEDKIKDKYQTEEKFLADVFPNVEDFKVITSVTASDKNENEVYISFSGFDNVKKVIVSYNSGNTWTDISSGLPDLPVNKIIFEEGSNNRLYAATDIGVYFKEGNNDWEVYGCDLPKTRITDFKIDYCERKLKVSTFGRGFWDVDLPLVDASNDYEVQGNVLWNGDMKVYGKVTIKQGSTLTIKGRVQFAENAGILVEKGDGNPNSSGKLIIDGGYLTSLCSTWKGIRVESNDIVQSLGWAGSVEIINNATISYADVGILNGGWDSDIYNLSGSDFGGIIRVDKVNFINNKVSIGFMNFENPNNLSYVLRSNFSVDDKIENVWNSNGGVYSNETFIWLNYSSLLNCERNVFENRKTSSFEVNELSLTGIVAQGSDLTLQRNTFNGLHRAIRFHDTGENVNLTAYNNTFEGCQGGIFMTGSGTANIHANSITKVGSHNPNPVDNFSEPYGLHFESFSSFNVYENTFDSFYENTFMVKVINSGSANNVIRNNFFSRGNVAVLSEGQNRNNTGSTGLVIACNEFSRNEQDISLLKGNSTIFGPKLNQPSLFNLAGNIFNSNCSNESQIKSDGVLINYYYRPNLTNQIITCYTSQFVNAISVNGKYDCFGTNDPVEAEPDIPTIDDVLNFQNLIYEYESNLITDFEELNTLNSTIDGGNTQELILKTSALSENFEEIISPSPYLSDTIISLVIDNAYQLQEFQYASLLLQNSPLSDVITQKYLSNPTLSATYHNLLMEYQDDYNAIFMLETNKILSTKERELIELDLEKSKKDLSNDSLTLANQNVKPLLESSLYLEHLLRVNRLNRIDNNNTYVNDTILYYDLLNKSIFINSLPSDSSQIQNIEIEDNQKVIYWLKGKLFQHDKFILVESVSTIGNKSNRNDKLNWTKKKNEKGVFFKVFPNPTSSILNYVITETSLESIQDLECQIYNSFGVLVKNERINQKIGVINLSDLVSGAYQIRIIDKNGVNFSQTFIKN